ncbi:amidohydrolase [Elongatibacter sediminis]|uniref:Amidohydrolase n=1 Tax=Elongatibacter sediminis TaxID=3119006 RepID=A0AAW9RAQ0_9GAMM
MIPTHIIIHDQPRAGRVRRRLAGILLSKTASILCCLAGVGVAHATDITADTVYRNGQIYTVDAGNPWAEAVVIKDGRFLYVGEADGAEVYVGPETDIVDLDGRMVLPGLHDAHQHLLKGQMRSINCTVSPESDVGQIIQALRVCQKEGKTRGEWIVADVYNGDRFPGGKAHRRYLDEAFPDTPIYLREWSYHHALVNSRALELAGIDRNTPDPDRGRILRDEAGEPTGELLSKATFLALKAVPPLPPETVRGAVLKTAQMCNEWGITSTQDAASNEEILREIQVLDELEKWPLHTATHIVINHPGSSAMSLEDMDRLVRNRSLYQSRHLDTDFVKLYVDGSPLQPHATDVQMSPDGEIPYERLYDSPNALGQAVARFDRMGIKVKMHAVGTGATHVALNAIAAARAANGDSGLFHDISHSLRYSAIDIPRLVQLGAVAEMSPAIWQIKGPLTRNLADAWAFRTLSATGALVTVGTDWVVLPEPNLFPALSGLLDHGEESLSLPEAIKTVTINGAISIGRQDEIGSIAPGKIADMIVLDRNLFEVTPADIADTRVLRTVFEGRVVYQAQE